MAKNSADEVKKVFQKFDTNGDDKISAVGLRQLLQAVGSETSPEDVKRMMEQMDKGSNGFVDLSEFSVFHAGSGGTC